MPDLNFTIEAPQLAHSSASLASTSAGSSTAPSKQEPPQKSPWSGVPAEPVMEAPEGILYDFNDGLRIKFP